MIIEFQPEVFSIAELVNEYDQISKESQAQEIHRKRTTIEINMETWAFATAVADTYGPTRTSFINDLLKCASQEFFARMHPKVRRTVAELADKVELMELKQAYKDAGGNVESHGPGLWTALAMAYEQRDAEKQLQDKQEGVK